MMALSAALTARLSHYGPPHAVRNFPTTDKLSEYNNSSATSKSSLPRTAFHRLPFGIFSCTDETPSLAFNDVHHALEGTGDRAH